MIWATVSSQSCFCWMYKASPSLAAKNIINLISVLTIWWYTCVESLLSTWPLANTVEWMNVNCPGSPRAQVALLFISAKGTHFEQAHFGGCRQSLSPEGKGCLLPSVGAVLTSHMVWPAESRLYFSTSLARGFCAVHKLENCTWRPCRWLSCCYIAGAERGWALCQS